MMTERYRSHGYAGAWANGPCKGCPYHGKQAVGGAEHLLGAERLVSAERLFSAERMTGADQLGVGRPFLAERMTGADRLGAERPVSAERMTGADQRREPRKALVLRVRMETASGVVIAVTRDISLSGLCLETAIPLRLGDEVVLILDLPDIRMPLVLLSQVRWVAEKRVAGLQFMAPRAYDVWALQRLLSSGV